MIRGSFARLAELEIHDPFPIVRVALTIEGITPEPAEVDFIVDSGARFTCLQPNDASLWAGIAEEKLRDPYAWPATMGGSGIGGGSIFFPMPAAFTFRHESGRHQTFRQTIYIAHLTPANIYMPSLMGWDVLRHFRVVLDYDAGDVRLKRRRGSEAHPQPVAPAIQ